MPQKTVKVKLIQDGNRVYRMVVDRGQHTLTGPFTVCNIRRNKQHTRMDLTPLNPPLDVVRNIGVTQLIPADWLAPA